MSALTSSKSVEFRVLDDTPGSGLSEVDAYALLAGVITPGQLAARGLLVASAEEAKRTGGMIALVPSDDDIERLTVDGGEPAEDLHLTLVSLGDDVTTLDDEARDKITSIAQRYVNGVIDADAFAVNIFNPHKIDSDGSPGGCVVVGVGRGDGLVELRSNIVSALGGLSGFELPEQHEPWVPHITLKYTSDFSDVGGLTDRVGPVTFDRLRVALGPDVTDIPLSEVLTAHGGSSHNQQDHAGDDVGDFTRRFKKARTGRKALKSARSSADLMQSEAVRPAAVDYYIATGARELNANLRTGGPRTHVEEVAVDRLDAMINESPLTDDVVVARGIANPRVMFGDRWIEDGDNTGLTWRDDAYVSTTTSDRVAEHFSRAVGGAVRMNILLPRGTHAMHLRNIADPDADYDQLLVARGLTYRIIRDGGVDKRGTRQLDVMVVRGE